MRYRDHLDYIPLNTGGPIGWAMTGGGMSTAAATGSALPALVSVLDGISGVVLASPKFARWLAKMPSNPALAEKHVRALSKIAANDNAIAADLSGLQQELMGLFAPARSAATPPPPLANGERTKTQGENQ